MGNENSKDTMIGTPQIGKASPLYWACRNGNLEAAKQILSTQRFCDMNQVESNGSTALHAAAFFGHDEIVRLLLHEYGVIQHRKNRHGLTAFQEASTNKARQHFERPENSRFCSNDDMYYLFDLNMAKDNEEEAIGTKPNGNWIDGASSNMDSYISWVNFRRKVFTNPVYQATIKTLCKVAFWSDNLEKMMASDLLAFIHTTIPNTHSKYNKAQELFSQYAKSKKVEPLLRLYSLETPFYSSLSQHNNHFLFTPLLWQLNSLKSRAFQGRSFRGLTMANEDLQEYQWALQHSGRLIRTCSFCSTSLDEQVARRFILSPVAVNRKRVLMVIDFPDRCGTAISLYTLSDELPSISDYENEKEILILPTTIFKVINIEQSADLIVIYLQNMAEFSVLKAIKKELVSAI